MLPRDPASTLSLALQKIAAGERLSRRTLPHMVHRAELLNVLRLCAQAVEHADAVDVTILWHNDTEHEARVTCRHCGGSCLCWPPEPDAIEQDPSLGSNIDPYAAEAMCGDCYQYLGSAVALRCLCSLLANLLERT